MSKSKPLPKMTRAEMDVLKVLWELEEASVRQIQEHSALTSDLAYTTVQTLVNRLEQKGAVRRSRKIGNAFMFQPVVSQQSVFRRMLNELIDLVGGSAQPVVAHLVEEGKISLADLKALEENVTAKRKRR
jgi:BlaI family transcriptional regulator, penicillinase repressor